MSNNYNNLTSFLNKNRVRLRNTIFGVIILTLVILMIIFVGFYITTFDDLLPSTRGELGQLGDYFGGLLNPIFGFASFLALLATIFYQSKELKLSRNELELTRTELANSAIALGAQNKAIELQSFEQTFFSWLNTYRDLLSSISGNVPTMSLEGKNYLYYLWDNRLSEQAIMSSMFQSNDYGITGDLPKNEFMDNYESFIGASPYNRVKTISNKKPQECYNHILIIWTHLYRKNEYQLDSLFRTLYRLLVWIDSQQTTRLSDAQKWLYISIVRSQLSWIEMAYLYYNGLTPIGSKFKPLIEKYALFDNLTVEQDVGMWVLNQHAPRGNGYKIQVFNSEAARKKLGLPKSSEDTLALATSTTNSFAAPSM